MMQQDAAVWQSLPSELGALHQWWAEHFASGVRKPDNMAEIDVPEIWHNNIAHIIRVGAERFCIGYCGLALIRRFGREATDAFVDTLAADIGSDLQAGLLRCVSSIAPVIQHPFVALGDMRSDHCDLILPLQRTQPVSSFLFASYEVGSPF